MMMSVLLRGGAARLLMCVGWGGEVERKEA